MKSLLWFAALLFCVNLATAQTDGILDSSFNNTGIASVDFGFHDNLNGLLVQPDQRILGVGVALNASYFGELKAVRFLSNGSLDPSFGTGGIVTLAINQECYGFDCVMKNNDKILLAGLTSTTLGYYDMLVVQLNLDGSIDSAFGTNGVATLNLSSRDDMAYAIALQQDGKILLCGYITDTVNYFNVPSVVRFTANGILDSTFGVNGVAQIPVIDIDNEFRSISVQADGKIIASGHFENAVTDYDILVVRFDSTGQFDPAFGTNGIVKKNITTGQIDRSFGMQLAENGHIVVGGFTTLLSGFFDGVLLKFDSTGTPEPAFGNNGLVTFDFGDEESVADLEIQADNKILIAGSSGQAWFAERDFLVGRYNADGSVDSTFGTNGFTFTTAFPLSGPDDANAMAVQEDGSIVVGGKGYAGTYNDFVVARYHRSAVSSIAQLPVDNTRIYPNPASAGESLQVGFDLQSSKQLTFELESLPGNLIQKSEAKNLGAGHHSVSFHLPEGLSGGIYFLKVSDAEGRLAIHKINVR